jgi:hypothetical protein
MFHVKHVPSRLLAGVLSKAAEAGQEFDRETLQALFHVKQLAGRRIGPGGKRARMGEADTQSDVSRETSPS